MATALKKLSFFGSVLQFLNKKDETQVQSARSAKISSYEDEIKLLLDAAELALPACVADGITLIIAQSDASKNLKKLIKHLSEVDKDVAYTTEKGATVIRVGSSEISVGGKINIPIFPVGQDYTHSTSPSQYAWKGTLHPDTLIVAVENFTKQKVDQGMLFYEQNKKLGRIFFDFKDLSPGITYVTPEDSVMLKRELSGVMIHFTFGRNLYWYHWDKQHQSSTAAAVAQPSTPNPIGNFKLKEKEDIHERLASNAKRIETVQRRSRPAKNSPKKMISAPAPPPLPPTDAMLVDSSGAPIPPPPPPPGGLKRKREDGDIPPPPPGLFSPMTGSATKKRKLRQLNWSAIPRSKIESTFWKDAGSPSKSNGFQIDESEIEDLFSLSPKTDRKNPHMDPNRSSKKITISLLSLKRANNSGILLSQFKMPHREIRDAIAHMNDELFTPEQLVSLKYLFPLSDTEKRAFQTFRGDPDQLANTDRFYWEMNDVQDPEMKVNLMVFKQQFRGNMDDVLACAKTLSSACEQLQTSKKFAQIMQVILKLGMVLNRSTITGANAQGFRLETLSRLGDTKTKTGKLTALDYVAQVINTKIPHVLDFDSELQDVPLAAKIVLDTVTSNVKEIGLTLKSLDRELEKYRNSKPQDKENAGPNSVGLTKQIDRFVQVMGPFYEESSKHFADAERVFTQAVHSFNNCAHFFGDEPKTTNPEQFFSVVAKFSEDLKKACKLTAQQSDKGDSFSTPIKTRTSPVILDVATPGTPAQ